jgi:hypothetical protein
MPGPSSSIASTTSSPGCGAVIADAHRAERPLIASRCGVIDCDRSEIGFVGRGRIVADFPTGFLLLS